MKPLSLSTLIPIILSMLICMSLLPGHAQTSPSDGKANSGSDSSKDLSRKYIFVNTDSSIHYAQEALILARMTNNKKLEGEAGYLLGGNYWIMGNYSKALGSILQSLQLFEALGDRENIADAYRAMASIYRDQGDFNNAILYADKCKSIAGDHILIDIYTIIGSIYEKFNRLDSALYYLKLANDKDIRDNGKNNYGYISLILGNVYHKQRNFPLAISYYRQGIRLIGTQKVYKDLIEAYTGIAKVYADMSLTDSGLVYSKKALDIGKSTPFLLGMLDASSMLSGIYRSRHNFDSTVKYMDLSFSIKETLYNQQQAREFQTLVFKEQLRQQEIEQTRARTEEERRENIQMVGIAAFIPAFFIVLVILSRRKMRPGIIDFMVLVGLLLFFEFISLVLHPHLEGWTQHRPILMLLALVLIAALLVPSHHRLEEWLKRSLVVANKKKAPPGTIET
jgi:tetratricopeptide (TPR) repeat protein